MGWTTLEESKLLVEAGLDPNTSDLCYCYDYDKSDFELTIAGFANVIIPRYSYNNSVYERKIPCWSLGALKNIVEEEFGKDFSYENGEWVIIVWTGTWGYKHYYFEEIVNCVIWLIQNNYIKKRE